MMLGFECTHGFVDHYEDCENVNKPECVKCRDKAKLISETMNGCFIGKWISVEDRLPPLEKEVLVFSHGIISVCSLIRPDQEAADVVWEDAYGYWDDDEGVAAVTHWMPLPEPPKEG